MVAIGRALMSRPKLLLLDEPFLGVAPIIIEEVMAAPERLSQDGVTLLLVEQNIRRAMDFVARAYVRPRQRFWAHRHRTNTTRERTPVEDRPACPRSLSMLSRAGAGSRAARPSIVLRPRWRRARSQTRRGSDPRESWLRTSAAPISARRSLLTACLRGSQEEIGRRRGASRYGAQIPDEIRAQARACGQSSNRSCRQTAPLQKRVRRACVPMTVSRGRD